MKHMKFALLFALTFCMTFFAQPFVKADDMSGMKMNGMTMNAKPAASKNAKKAKPAKKSPAKSAKKPRKSASKSSKTVKAAAASKYECSKCHMVYSAADAKKYHFVDPMDGGKLLPVKK